MRFPEFSGEWEKNTVSDLLEFFSTNSLSWEELDYQTNVIYNLHYGLIHLGLPTLVDIKNITLPSISDWHSLKNYEVCRNGDIAFADASEDIDEVAKAVEFTNIDDEKIVCGLHCIHGRDKTNKTSLGFKGYAFSSSAFHNQIRRLAQGSKVYSINRDNFSECSISIPSKAEQSKIATFLNLIDTRIATQNKIIEDLKKLRGAIIDKSYKGNAQQEKLGNLIVQQTKRNTALQLNNVLSVNNKLGFISQSDQFEDIVVASSDIRNYKIVMPNDFAYNPARINVGSIARLKDQASGIVSPMYVCFRAKDSISPQYLEYFFETSQCKLAVNKKLEGSVRQCLSFESLCSILITNPKKNEQEEIIRKIDLITKKISILECLSEKYNKEKRYMLQQMFI